MKPRETDFLDKYLRHLKDDLGAVVWTEVRVPEMGTADAVVLVDGFYTVVEGKAELSYRLLSQCCRWNRLAHRTVAVIPMIPHTDEAFQLARQNFMQYGIGIQMVGGYVSDICVPHFFAGQNGIESFLRESMLFDGKFAKAGTAGGKRATARNEKHLAIEEYVAANPECTAAQAAKAGDLKASQLIKLVNRGELNLQISTICGKSYLTPLTK